VGAFDPVNGVLVVFGGIVKTDVSAPVAETWTYSPASNSWKQLQTAALPPARYSGAMVYDPVAKRMILHCGIPKMNEGRLGDTWALTSR
jgi:N-acetylneuraminic acid mutarotase